MFKRRSVRGFILSCLVLVALGSCSLPPTPTPTPTMVYPAPSTFFLGFNVTKPPVDQVQVRRGLALAIDREALLQATGREGEPATSFVPPELWPDGESRYGQVGHDHDPAGAAGLLAPFLPLPTFFLFAVQEVEPVANHIASAWEACCGLAVAVHVFDVETYFEMLDTVEPAAFLMGWVADSYDPADFLSDGTYRIADWTKWPNVEAARLANKASQSPDPAEALDLFLEAERLLCERETSLVPLHHYWVDPE